MAPLSSEAVGSAAGHLATLAGGLFAGCALWVSAVEHPAGMESDVSGHFKFFPHMYKRGACIQATLSIGSAAAAAVAAANGGHCSRVMWGGAAALMAAQLPYTVLAIFPTNDKIKQQATKDVAEQAALLERWGRLHMVRTALALASLGLMVLTLHSVKNRPGPHGSKA